MVCPYTYKLSTTELQAPGWVEIGTHIGTSTRCVGPTNIPDGLYCVPIVETLKLKR